MALLSSKQSFDIRSIQSALREVGLYIGKIDGFFGNSSYNSFDRLLNNKPIKRIDSYDGILILKAIQQCLIDNGHKLNGGADGIWGVTSQNALDKEISAYRLAHKLNSYGYAWSNHKAVPMEGIRKIEKWLGVHNKPKEHVSFVLSSMCFETAGTFSPAIQNKDTRATGLIQFMPSVARQMGTTIDRLKTLSFVDQLDWVFKYFEMYGYIKKCNHISDYYLSIFRPASVGGNLDTVVARVGTKLYSQNIVFDPIPRKGFYTNGDIASPVIDRYFDGMSPSNRIVL